MDAIRWDYTSPFVYDGTEKEVKLVNVPAVVSVRYVGNKATNAGSYTATAIFTHTEANFEAIPNKTIEWKIEKATLQVSAKPHSIVYGDNPANNGVTFSGFKGNDTVFVLGGVLDFDYTYAKGDDAGIYSLTPKSLSSPNYNFDYVDGVLTVDKKDLTIKVNDVIIPYNSDVVDCGISSNDFVNGDTVADLGEYTFNFGGYAKGSDVGEYDITIDGTLNSTNYNINVISGKLTVIPIDVDIDTTEIALKVNEFIYDGTNFESKLEVINLPYGVSCKNIVVKDKTPIDAGDYVAVIYLEYFDTLNYNPMGQIERTFKIKKATVDSFDAVSLSFNSVIYNGYEQIVELKNIPTGAKIKTLTGNRATEVGVYTVNVSFVNLNSNYVDFKVNKNLTWNIMPAPLRIIAKDKTITYGDNVPVCDLDDVDIFTFAGSDDSSVLEGFLTFDITYNKGDDAKIGFYTITPKGVTAKNYQITFVPGYLNVEKVKIDMKNVDWVKNFSYVYSGEAIKPQIDYVSNEFVEVIYSYIKVGGGFAEPINVGKYVAMVEIVANKNYEIINNNIVDYEYEIVSKPIDCSMAIWQGKEEYILGEEIVKPVLINLPSEVVVSCKYYLGDVAVEEFVAAGSYKAIVTINPINDNCIILKYPTMEFDFVISEQEIENPEEQNNYNIKLVVGDAEYVIYKDCSLDHLEFDSSRSVYVGTISIDYFFDDEYKLTLDSIYVFEGVVVEDLCANSYREIELTDGYAENVWLTILSGYDSGPYISLYIMEYNATIILHCAD